MTFTKDLSYGAQGDDVKRIQEALNKTGKYNLTVDGIWGKNTDAAIRDYQKNNSLTVDGIFGKNTYASLFGTGTSGNTSGYIPYDPGEYKPSDAVTEAIKKANGAASAVTNHPKFDTIWDDEVLKGYESDYKDWKDKGFSYDFDGDAIYQQYKDKYIQQGKLAMADVIGQASAMTGGYGNSYAQTVGNQAYQAQLQNLNDIIPELYAMAYDKHRNEGQDILDMIALEKDNKNFAYGKYMDEVNKLIADRTYYQGIADKLSADDYNRWFDNATIEQTEHHNKATFDEGVRQFDEQMKLKSGGGSSGGSSGGSGGGSSGGSTGGTSGGSGGGNNPPKGETGFTGKTYDDAVNYALSKGVPNGDASGIMTASEWNRRKSSYQAFGTGGAEVKNYNSYQEYLKAITEYLIEKNTK